MASFISHPKDAQGNCKYVLFINEIKMKQFLFYTTSFLGLNLVAHGTLLFCIIHTLV